MSQRQAGGEVKAKSIAEKAKICLTCEDAAENEGVMSEEYVSEPGEAYAEAAADGSVDAESEVTENSETTVKEKPDPLTELYGDTEIRMDLQVDKWDMYAFLMHHSYISLSGVIGIILSLVCIGRAISDFAAGQNAATTALFMIIGLWFLVINPITMIGKAAMQIRTNATLQKPITYIFTEKGMIQEQGEARAGCRWDQVTRTVMMKRIWILYTGKQRGSVLPVRQLGGCTEELKALIRQQTGKKR